MKFIIVAIIVSAFALSFSSGLRTDFITPFFRRRVLKDTFYNYTIVRNARIDFSSRYAYVLGKNYFDTQSAILETWRLCDEELLLYPLFDRSLHIFENPTIDETRNLAKKDKCLYYCMMNGTGVLTDEGFQDEVYMDYIRKLRFNSTSIDIDNEPMARRELSNAIYNLARHLNTYRMDQSIRRSMNDIIKSYAQAARECKHYRLSMEMDKCDEATFILWCMMARKQRNGINCPFFPLWLKSFWDSFD